MSVLFFCHKTCCGSSDFSHKKVMTLGQQVELHCSNLFLASSLGYTPLYKDKQVVAFKLLMHTHIQHAPPPVPPLTEPRMSTPFANCVPKKGRNDPIIRSCNGKCYILIGQEKWALVMLSHAYFCNLLNCNVSISISWF